MKNSLEEQLDRMYVVKRSPRQHINKIMARILRKVLINRFTVSTYSLLSKDDIGIFADKVFAERFDRYMMGFDREAAARMIAYRPAGEFVMGIGEIGNLSFSKLPVDISDKSEPEIRAFTKEDVQKSEGVLDITVVDSVRNEQYEYDSKCQNDNIKDFEAYTRILNKNQGKIGLSYGT